MKPDMMLVGKKTNTYGGFQLWFLLKSIPHYLLLLSFIFSRYLRFSSIFSLQ